MTDVVETPTESPATNRRGRPRPEGTVQRDEQVFNALAAAPKTREQLAQELELEGKQVYLSLYRLHTAGRITRTRDGGNHVWGHAPGTPATE